jgi:PAS domain S-box-containing protein
MALPKDHHQSALGRTLFVVVSLFVCIVILIFLLGAVRSMILSSLRAYIQAESYWSKAQKESVISLIEYADSDSQADFQAYLNAIRVPLGYKFARLELEKPSPDMTAVYQEFLRAQMDADDIPGLVRMFRWLHRVSFMRNTIADWAALDREIDNLTELADQLHAETFSDSPNTQRVRQVLEEIEACDSRLTLLENNFSSALVVGERWIRELLNFLTIGTSVLLLVLGIGTSRYLLKNVRRSEEKYRRLFDSASDAILILDHDTGSVLEANGRAAEFFGVSAERLAGMPESALFPIGEAQSYRELFRAGLSGGEAHSVLLKLRRADGRSVEVDASVRLIELEGPRQPVILAIFRDTTELKRLNRALFALSRCDQELVRATNEQELLEKVCQITVNTGGYRMAWVAFPEQDEKKSVRVAAEYGDQDDVLTSIDISWSDTPKGRGAVGTALRTGEICVIHDAQNDPRPKPWGDKTLMQEFLSVISLPLMEEQVVLGSLNIYSTEDNVFDAEEVKLLRELAANLAYGISSLRVRSEHERKEGEVRSLGQQLRQAQKMESLGRLAGGVAHDFNNLLTIIGGHTDLLADRLGADDSQKRSVDQIQKASNRAVGMTRQLLAFSRMQVLQTSILDLNSVISEMGKMLPRLIGEHIEFTFIPEPKLAPVKADPGQVEQVLINLAVNARDAMPDGGKLVVQTHNISLSAAEAAKRPVMAPGEYVLVSVSDTGQGMNGETKARIFEPFFTTKEVGKGTGLGLATVYGIVKQSGGFIWVESAPGRGAIFEIYLPKASGKASAVSPEPAARIESRGTETILLVEDEPGVRDLASQFLRASGYSVLEAADGVQALEVAEKYPGPIHLLLSDMVMPRMSGKELMQRLLEARKDMKIILMSGYSEYNGTEFRQADSIFLRLGKPFSLASLVAKVREALGPQLVGQSSPRSESN